MKFWTTDHISEDNRIFRLWEENPNPSVGRLKDYIIATIFYHDHGMGYDDDISYTVNFEKTYVDNPREMVKEFSTLEEAKEYVEDVLGLEDEDVVNSDFDLDFVKPYKGRGYYRPHELGLP